MSLAIQNNCEALQQELIKHNLDGFLIPSNDEFQSEYVPEHNNRLKFMTGFTGSNGTALILKTQIIFFTDGRYLLQASQELPEFFIILDIAKLYDNEFLVGKIGYDPKLYRANIIAKFKNANLIESDNLVDLIWRDRPQALLSEIYDYPLKYAGEASINKIAKITQQLQKDQIDALIITDPANICWLLNIRGGDIAYTPIILAYLILDQNGDLELFCDSTLKNKKNYPLAEFAKIAQLLADKKVQLDPDSVSIWISKFFGNITWQKDPCSLAKACKNLTEIRQAKRIHIADGVAICRFFYWLSKNYSTQSEISIAEKLLEFRKAHKDFIYPSFPTIAGFAENGAIIHYHAKESTNKPLDKNGILLIDSGGQYFGGTTDITRVIAIGNPTYEQKLNYTLVLKGHIALARAIFPKGTNGAELDILARQYLWQQGKDYPHGTGHGVGSFLSVHEGPQSIRKANLTPLQPGMILSNEPGIYLQGKYGIRIENLMLVKELKSGFLGFESLTFAPLENKLILHKLLNQEEKNWLKAYHAKVYSKISPYLNRLEKAWLEKQLLISKL